MDCKNCEVLKKKLAKAEQERDDWIKIAQLDNQKNLKEEKKKARLVKKKKYISLIDKAIELGLIVKNDYVLLNAKPSEEEITDEWQKLETWVNELREYHVHIGLDGKRRKR